VQNGGKKNLGRTNGYGVIMIQATSQVRLGIGSIQNISSSSLYMQNPKDITCNMSHTIYLFSEFFFIQKV